MQTFLPYPDFYKSLSCLDNKRLGKQRVEAYQILLCLRKPNRWKNHPAVKMWKGYEGALIHYMNCAIDIWENRGFKNTMKRLSAPPFVDYPIWYGKIEFHSSHRSNLLRKDNNHYSQYGWREPDNLPYYWPTNNI